MRSTTLEPNFEELAGLVQVDKEQNKRDYLKDTVLKILPSKKKYQAVEAKTGVPWRLIAAIHFKESSLNFKTMLHNGEPLNKKSRIVPVGVGPFSNWEASAYDALIRQGSSKVHNWSLASQLEFAESYNGKGYRKHDIYSPYVFGFTNLSEEKGGYPRDHVWDSEYAYKRPGVAAILLALDYAEGGTGNEPQVGQTSPLPTDLDKSFFGAPWIGANIDLLGLDETNSRLVERYEPEWKKEGLPDYKTLSGRSRAWCSVRENADKRKVGVKGTNSAAASSWSKWGRKSPFWFGATLDIQHPAGGRHVCDFLYWIDEKNKICATLDGNRDNKFCVARTDLKKDKLVTGPRWSNEVADGQLVTKEQVLAKYPFLKVGGSVGDSTT